VPHNELSGGRAGRWGDCVFEIHDDRGCAALVQFGQLGFVVGGAEKIGRWRCPDGVR
jgi:hypothetical protein